MRSVSLFGAQVVGALLLFSVSTMASATVHVCALRYAAKVQWHRADADHPDPHQQFVKTVFAKHHVDLAVEEFAAVDRKRPETYVFTSSVLQNSHPGYHFWIQLFFACATDGRCSSFDFSTSKSISFPDAVEVYRSTGMTIITARGFDEQKGRKSTDRYALQDDEIKKCPA